MHLPACHLRAALLAGLLLSACSSDEPDTKPVSDTVDTQADVTADVEDDAEDDAEADADADDAGDAGPCADGGCQCQDNQDCLSREDGNPCNGTLYCDPKIWSCKVNPATVIACQDDAAPCVALACDPADGDCRPVPADEGEACDDGESCTKDDACKAGVCVGKSTCDCTKQDDCLAWDDDNKCKIGRASCRERV